MIRVSGSRFTDEHGRTLILRGVNLGGSSKVPRRPNGATYLRGGFFDHRNVSFVGRPFLPEEAGEHFTRLRAWGFTRLRFLVTWEAIEHAGPGLYDEAYLDYVRAVVEKAGRYGFDVFVDPHQDVWSRFSGGDGAPGWTFEAVGLDITQFSAPGAAVVHQLYDSPFPRMIWPCNETRLAAATMFTLFFGGNDFAPATRVEGEPVQDYLQRHYLAAICRLAERLKGLPNVVGYDTLNEPLRAYLGWADLRAAGGRVKVGPCPSPHQAMLLGAGYPQSVDVWEARVTGFKRIGQRLLNEGRARVWLPGHDCVWRQNGVWDVGADGEPRLLRPDYFARRDGRPVDFSQDYYLPFARRFAEAIRAVDPQAVIFVESAPQQPPPRWDAPNIVYAPHWYDGFVLFFKDCRDWLAVDSRDDRLVFTPWHIRRSFADQLNSLRREAAARLPNAPTLIGEFGIAFDLQNKRAYRKDDFGAQIKALDRTFRAFEDTLSSGALWNYTADNTNAHGDLWNDEDLSLFSRDQQTNPQDIHSGGRALAAVVRPYARAVAGEPLRMRFDRRRVFEFTFRHDPHLSAPTELFVPDYQYPRGYRVTISDGAYEVVPETQTLVYRHTLDRDTHTVRIQPRAD
jgi:glycosyl hydrolase family 5/cellulase (glycosyl hydrolase family 5)